MAIAGYTGLVLVNSTTLRAHRWSVDWKVQDFDVTTFLNEGIGSYLGGLTDYDISFDAYYDPLDNPFTAPLSLAPGTFVKIEIRFTGTLNNIRHFVFPNCLVTDARNESGVRDVVHYSITAKASVTDQTIAQVPTNPIE